MNTNLAMAPLILDRTTFDAQAAAHRRALHVHCYRMVGSFTDADDLVQETLLRAWNARATFDAATEDVGLRRWLYRIATNACLDFLRSPARKAAVSARSIGDQPWLQPYPDVLLDEAAVNKESIALGFLSLIQTLPARQRAVYILRDVLGWSAAETATALALTVAAANSALQRARDTVGQIDTAPTTPTADERAALAAFIDAHERGDAAAALAQMHRDIRICMPPHPMCFDGLDAVRPLTDGLHIGAWRLVPAWANRMPAAISYLRRAGDTVFRAFKIDVLRLEDGLVREVTTFEPTLIAAFGAPAILPEEA